ncbi:MAG: TonB-dependent receptor, partial [Pseudomonadales bacterium]|nr:TonB-dependent receptor [Pseudomonadales bacterium]
ARLFEHIVVTARPAPTAAGNVASSISSLGGADLARMGHRHIAEALQQVPGANFSRGSGQEYLPALRSPVLSGAGACGSVLAAENGMPLRAAGFCNVNELFESHSEAARAIELVRGPGQTAFGANAVHGVVNVLPRNASAENEASFEAGDEDFYRGHLGYSGNDNWRADLTLAQDRGFRESSGYDLQKLSLHKQQGQRESWMSLSHLDQDTAAFLVGSDAYRNEALSRENASPEAYRKASSLRAASRYTLDAPPPGQFEIARAVVTPYLRHAEMEFLMHFLPGEPVETNRQTSVGVQAYYALESAQHLQLQCGGNLELTDAALRQIQFQPTQGSPFLIATIPQGKQYDYEVLASQSSLFCDANWQPVSGWNFQAGLRYEHMAYDYDNRMLDGRTDDSGVPCAAPGCRYSRPADRRDHFNNWSPFVGVTQRYSLNHQWFANMSHGFRAPQATELYRLQREQQSADLDAEEMTGFEAGLRGAGNKWQYELVGFSYRKRNVIFRDSDFFNVDGGKTEHRGVELALQVKPLQMLELGLSGTYASHRYSNRRISGGEDINGNLIDTAPRHLGSAFARWRPNDSWWVEARGIHVSRYYTNPENANRYPGHDYFNLLGGWQKDHWSFVLRLINATNVRYAERADNTQFSGDRYFPGRPRTLFGELRYSWE